MGVPELLIVAVIVLLLFGPGKAQDIGGALGKSIREFRKASKEDDDDPAPARASSQPAAADMVAPSADVTVVSGGEGGAHAADADGSGRFCTSCGTRVAESHKFCTSCGASVLATTN
ncbi:MAG TPA: twin-arginine translocase TatA/TatE family subunit [Dehalococcoidia bacterium]|nr:twin-arginine translocase TatA/TatE family subunit [Dehalococcoidia bacterium]